MLEPGTPERAPRAIQLAAGGTVLDEGDTARLTATVLDQQGRPFDTLPPGVRVVWASADDSVARVDTAGVVTALAPGEVRISASVASGGAVGASVAATVAVLAVPTAIVPAAGDGQSGTVGVPLSDSLRVRVDDRRGNGVADVPVAFAVTAGGGTLSADTVFTGADGIAVAQLTLGTVAGAHAVAATTPRLPDSSARFSATALPGPAAVLEAVSGDGQRGLPGVPLPLPLTVRATDQFANAIPGLAVAWQVTTGGGSVSAPAAPTDSLGEAAVTWTLGGDPTQSVQADAAGLAATFTASLAIRVASVDVTPSAETMASGTTRQLTAVARDSAGGVLSGRTVSWSSSAPTVAAVDGAGLVTAALVGSSTITATIEGVDGTATVTVTPGVPDQLVFTTQPSAVLAGQPITPAVAVTARDAAGNVVPTMANPVTMALGANPGGATLGGTTDVDLVDGVATFIDLTVSVPGTGYTLVASVPGVPAATSAPFDVGSTGPELVAWLNPAGGSWSDGSNWTTGRAPGPNDTVLIALGGTYTVTHVDAVEQLSLLILGDGGVSGGTVTLALSAVTLTADSGVDVLPGGVLDLTGGTVAGAAGLFNDGTVVLRDFNGTPATISATYGGPGTLRVRGRGTLSGTVTIPFMATVEVASAGADTALLTFVNGAMVDGTIVLSNVDPLAPRAAVLAVTNGALQVVESGEIHSNVGTMGGARILRAEVLMQRGEGTPRLQINQDLLVDSPSAQHQLLGEVLGADVTVRQTGTSPTVTISYDLTIGTGRSFIVEGGTVTLAASLRGGGTIDVSTATFIVNGTIVPSGVLAVVGDLPMNPLTVTAIDIGGTTPGSGYRRVAVSGTATVDGRLAVRLFGGFTPAVGDTFAILTAASVTGAFATPILPPLPVGTWELDYTPTAVIARVTAPSGAIGWINPAGGAWSDPNNWSSGTVPGPLDTAAITLGGTYTVTHVDDVVTVGRVVLGDDGQFGGTATLQLSAVTLRAAGGVAVRTGSVLDMTGGSVTGAGGVVVDGALVLRDFNGAAATIGSPLHVAGTSGNGLLSVRGLGAVTGALTTSNSAVIEIAAEGKPAAELTVTDGFVSNGDIVLSNLDAVARPATLTVTNGTLRIEEPGELRSEPGTAGGGRSLRAELNNGNYVYVDQALVVDRPSAAHQSGGQMFVRNGDLTFLQTGTTPSFTNTFSLQVDAGRTLTIDGGAFTNTNGLQSAGTLNVAAATFATSGTLSPNAFGLAGTFTVTGSVPMEPASTLLIDVGGLAAGTQHDQLAVSGAVTVNGTLQIGLINGFTPSVGDSFPIVTAASVTGTFVTTFLPALPLGAWQIDYTPTSVIARVVP